MTRDEMVQAVREAGTDSLSYFGNGYTHEGGLYLQQNPEEFADLVMLLKGRGPINTFLEIGSASGGALRFLYDHVGFGKALSIDDGEHPRAREQARILSPVQNVYHFDGNSHSRAAEEWLAHVDRPDVAFIDGDHSYEGVTWDVAMVLRRVSPGALIILHDIVACEDCDGVALAWRELLASGKVKRLAEFVGAERPLGIGVAEVLPVDDEKDTKDSAVSKAYEALRTVKVSAQPHVMLATPAYNPPCLEFLHSREMVLNDLHTAAIGTTVITSPGDSLVMRGRHALMAEFLKSSATHLLFWDVDIEVLDPSIVRQMMATGHDIIGGACPFRGETGKVVCNITKEDMARKAVDTDDTGSIVVNEVGTGFLLMSRKAIVRMCEAHPELLYFADLLNVHGAPMWALFDTQIVNHRFLSEDYFFCALWRGVGGKVHVYVPFEARHWGRKGFEASLMKALGMKDTA